ncbi:hypothetical protein JCM5296_000301 [Sporobolomyces johnsonii]
MSLILPTTELRQLILYDLTLTTSSASFTLPRLVHLSAAHIVAEPPLSPTFLTAETAPCLRLAARVASSVSLQPPARGQLLSPPSPDLASKLEIVLVEFDDWSNAHSASPSCGPRTVVDCSFFDCASPFDPTLPPISHLQLHSAHEQHHWWMHCSLDDLDDEAVIEDEGDWIEDQVTDAVLNFDTLADMLTASHPVVSALRSVHLPNELESDMVPEVHPGLSHAYQHLSRVCARHGVEILLGTTPQSDIDSFIPRRTLEWMRAQGSRD